MPVRINVGLTKKVGQQNYGSLGATCNVEFELDGGYDNGSTDRFQDAVKRAYAACREALDAELSTHQSNSSSHLGGQHRASRTERGTTAQPTDCSNVRAATASQIRAIYAISNRSGISLSEVLKEWNVSRPDDLLIGDASSVIDQLKSSAGSIIGEQK